MIEPFSRQQEKGTPMIKPTVGRVVWYRPNGAIDKQPHAALITHVWSENCVNLAIFDSDGHPYQRTSVTLLQAGDLVPQDSYAEWMPYQLGQARQTEALVKKLGELPEDITAATRSDPALNNLPRG
jgi:hypothetical protein